MQPFVLHDFAHKPTVEQALLDVDKLVLSRYDNPFERKSFLEDKSNRSVAVDALFYELVRPDTVRTVQRLLDLPIANADYWHYGGLFVYGSGDYLAPHVDAGIHPITKQRKVATACLYLTPATLSLWHGDSCLEERPEVWLEEPHLYRPNDCVLFANHDSAWHGVPLVSGLAPRVVLTVSYMADVSFDRAHYKNTRTRAYFAKRHGVSDGLDELREQRASEQHHTSMYRMEHS